MRIQCDSLKYTKILEKKGIQSHHAKGLISTITEMDIFNIYSQKEVDSMLSESVEKVFARHKEELKKQDIKIAEQRREMKAMEKYRESQLLEQRKEFLSSRRWLVGTIITVGFSLAAYLSALIHYVIK